MGLSCKSRVSSRRLADSAKYSADLPNDKTTIQPAIIASGPGQLAIKHDAPVPALTPDMVLVKTAAVAINPADAKRLDYSAAAGTIHGYDFAGTIVKLGINAPPHLAVGDRVAGFVHGMNALKTGRRCVCRVCRRVRRPAAQDAPRVCDLETRQA